MQHLLLGSIGVLAETSELQRQCFNTAFQEAGLDWYWDQKVYSDLLKVSGGQARIENFADPWETVDAEALHRRKSELFQLALAEGIPLREGVAASILQTRQAGGKVACVTTTSPENVDSILAATELSRDLFDLVLDRTQVSQSKPSPEAYLTALKRLDIAPGQAIAVEDNPDGVTAAIAARIPTIAFPGALHAPSAFEHALDIQSVLHLSSLDRAA